MRIIINEMKKIFNLRSVLIMLFGALIIYKMFADFHIREFPNGRPDGDIYNLSVEMSNRYGNSMDEEEFKDFKLWREEVVKEADEYLRTHEEYVKAGVDSYDMIRENEVDIELHHKLVFEDNVDFPWILQSMDYIINNYEGDYYRNFDSELKNERLNEIKESGAKNSIFNEIVQKNYDTFISNFSIIILASIIFLLCPIFIKDKASKVDNLQYSSRIGRGVFKKKILAGVISTLGLTTIYVSIALGLYSGNNTSMFFDCNINSIFNNEFWIDITFKGYIILTIVFIYILALVTSLITMYLSSKAESYIKVIALVIPIGAFIINKAYSSYIRRVFYLVDSPLKTPLTYGVLIFIAITLVFIRMRKFKLEEIFD